jgi:hypothetical protein
LFAAVGAAVTALRTAPGRVLNQRLATILVLDGMFVGVGSGFIFFFESRAVVSMLSVFATAALVALPFQYLAFLAHALDAPVFRHFRSGRAYAFLSVISIAGASAVLLAQSRFQTELYSPGWAPWNFRLTELGQLASQLHAIVALLALVAAISAYARTKPCTAARSRAKWFVIAFGVRDLYFLITSPLYGRIRPIQFWGDFLYNPVQSAVYLAFVLLLSYAVLHTQLLNIELRLKIALERSTVIAIVAAGFLIGSEALEQLLPVQSKIIGLVLAVSLALAATRLERLSKRMLDRVMPGVAKTEAYLGTRRIELYRAALEGAAQDGVITTREQAILSALRQKLNLTDDEADLAEREFRSIMASARPTTQKIAV